MFSKGSSQTFKLLKTVDGATCYNLLDLEGGNFFIPKECYNEFSELYARECGQYRFYFSEQKSDVFPYFLDLDFDTGTTYERLEWLQELLRFVEHNVIENLFTEFGENKDVFPQSPSSIEDYTTAHISHRQGLKFHVVFPKLLVMSEHAQMLNARLRIWLRGIIPSVDWAQVVDESVAKKNGLRMLGSYKKDIWGGCYIPCTIDWDTYNITDLPITAAAIQANSVYQPYSRQREDGLHLHNLNVLQHEDTVGPQAATISTSSSVVAGVPLECLRVAVMGLTAQFYGPGSYNLWSCIILCIHNVSVANGYEEAGQQLAQEFSKQDPLAYDGTKIDQLFSRSRAEGVMCGFGTVLHHLKACNPVTRSQVDVMLQEAQQLQERTAWDSQLLLNHLQELLPELRQPQFTFTSDSVTFEYKSQTARIARRDAAMYVGKELLGYLAKDVPLVGHLTRLHKEITDAMEWKLTLHDPKSAILSSSNSKTPAEIAWHNPWNRDACLILTIAGLRKGPAAITQKKIITLVEKEEEEAVQVHLQQQFGISQTLFNNCTFNINIAGRDVNNSTEGDKGKSAAVVCQDVTDSDAAERFVNVVGKDKFRRVGGITWIYLDHKGMWSAGPDELGRLVQAHKEHLRFKCTADEGETVCVKDYAKMVTLRRRMLEMLPDFIETQDDFWQDNADTAVNKLLFTDGIYDMKTGDFKVGFDTGIYFPGRIPRPFPKQLDEEAVAFVDKVIFSDPFTDEELQQGVPEFLKRALASALAMDYRMRKMYYLLGNTSSGKGVLLEAVQRSFPDYFGILDMANFRTNKHSSDSARDLGWLVSVYLKRFVFSSEVCMKIILSGDSIKSFVSGGDPMVGRGLYKDEQRMTNRSTLFVCAQDLPKIVPMDQAVVDRVGAAIDYNIRFSDSPDGDFEKPIDRSIKVLFSQPRFQDAFTWILINAYKRVVAAGNVPPPCLKESTKEWACEGRTLESILEQNFVITRDKKDTARFEDIRAWVNTQDYEISDTKLGKELTRITSHKSKVENQGALGNKTLRYGIKMKVPQLLEQGGKSEGIGQQDVTAAVGLGVFS